MSRFVDYLWNHRWAGAAASLALGALAGLLVAVIAPLGPVTSAQAIIILLIGIVTGLTAGYAMRSRWALLAAPLGYLIAFEAMHFGSNVVSLGAVRLDETYGILALILGRGFHGVIALLPMALAAELGVRSARSRAGAQPWPRRATGWLPAGLAALALPALVVALLWPARTPQILGADGRPLPGSIAELVSVDINGAPQSLLIRTQDATKPVLLYLAGGPGQSSLPHPRVIFEDFEKDFVVVDWDQRGTGKSYAALDPDALTPAQAVDDTIAVTNYLRERFAEEKIYLVGESYGTILAVLAAQARPISFMRSSAAGRW